MLSRHWVKHKSPYSTRIDLLDVPLLDVPLVEWQQFLLYYPSSLPHFLWPQQAQVIYSLTHLLHFLGSTATEIHCLRQISLLRTDSCEGELLDVLGHEIVQNRHCNYSFYSSAISSISRWPLTDAVSPELIAIEECSDPIVGRNFTLNTNTIAMYTKASIKELK